MKRTNLVVVYLVVGCGNGAAVVDMALEDALAEPADSGVGRDLAPRPDLARCTTDPECKDLWAPLCGAGGMCEACSGASDDARCAAKSAATPRCKDSAPMLGQCVQCRPATQAADCATAAPICGSDGACRGCKAHSECPSGVCILDGASAGQCAPENMVTYVDNTFAGCAAGNGARANPVCEVTTALVSGRPNISVKGSSTAYTAISVTTGAFTIVGPGRSASPTAKMTPSASPAVLVNTTGVPASVIMDGFELIGSGGGTPNPAVKCTFNTGAASVTVRNSLLRMSGGAGVETNGCTVNLNSNIISSNGGGGVSLGGTGTYAVTNNIIGSNGISTVPGVFLGNGVSGVFAFNTVAKNRVSAGVGGIDCGTGAAKVIQNSIVWGNDLDMVGGSQLGTKCTLSNVVTGTADNQGAKQDPAFVSATDFHLTSGSAANVTCGVDKVSNPATPNANVDVDGATRPRGAAHDTGAHEVQ